MILQHWPTSLCSYHTISIIRCLIEYHRKYLLLKYLLITEVSSSQVRSIFGLERVGLVEWIYSCDKRYLNLGEVTLIMLDVSHLITYLLFSWIYVQALPLSWQHSLLQSSQLPWLLISKSFISLLPLFSRNIVSEGITSSPNHLAKLHAVVLVDQTMGRSEAIAQKMDIIPFTILLPWQAA